MKAVIQRVLRGAVTVDGETVGAIDKGMVVLLGIGREDAKDDVDYIVRKILGARIWPSPEEKQWCLNVRDINGGILLISQFTLMHVMKGNKPDFHNAMPSDQALAMFGRVREALQAAYAPDKVATGKFQHYMNISLVNDGPVTLVLDSKNRD